MGYKARILSGILKGRFIDTPKIDSTRPTTDALKETIVNILIHRFFIKFEEYGVIDLFAGSGSLGFESISMGSKKCLFIDNNKIAINCLYSNIKSLKVEEYSAVWNNDALKLDHILLSKIFGNKYKKFIVFLDPPYKNKDLLLKSIENLRSIQQKLNISMFLVIETDDEKFDIENTIFIRENSKHKLIFVDLH